MTFLLIVFFLYITEANYDKEQDWKFRYVYKGPENARQKKLHYVFGKGLNNRDKGILRGPEPRPEGVGYKWPSVFKQHGHIYFDISFLKQSTKKPFPVFQHYLLHFIMVHS